MTSSRKTMTALMMTAVMLALPAAAEKCVDASLANKGSYILTFKAYGHNEKCSGTTSYQVPGGNEASMDVVSGHTVEITGAACIPDIAKCHYTFVCDEENSCENLVCDGFFPENLKCHRKSQN